MYGLSHSFRDILLGVSKEKILTTEEAAKELGVSQSRIYALVKNGRLKAEPFGKMYLIRFSDLDAVRERKNGRPRKSE